MLDHYEGAFMEELNRFAELLGTAKAQAGFFHKKQFQYFGLKGLEKYQKDGTVDHWDILTYRLRKPTETQFEAFHLVQLMLVNKHGWPATAFSHTSALYLHGLGPMPDKYFCRPITKTADKGPQCMVLDCNLVDSDSLDKIDGLWTTNLVTTLNDLLNSRHDYRVDVADAVLRAKDQHRLSQSDVQNLSLKNREFIEIVCGWNSESTPRTASATCTRSLAMEKYDERLKAAKANKIGTEVGKP